MQPGQKRVAAIVRDRHHLRIGIAQGADVGIIEIVNTLSNADFVCHCEDALGAGNR
jgi:hypothetical protein